MGRNGVGKTSILKAIVGHKPISSGTIIWEKINISNYSSNQRAKSGIAYVPQGREIFPLLTVQENLQTGFSALQKKDRFIQDEIFELFPILKNMLKRKGGDLSGGQQQQLSIARALITRPRLLVLDEPTEGIQPSIIKNIDKVIRFLAKNNNMAILLVEQYFEFAKNLADNFVVIERGEVVLSGNRNEMIEEDVRKHLTI
tara:strand:+ start:153 stop:752 length:600 start_codon:yes stop_codon:yes gene_type:complete